MKDRIIATFTAIITERTMHRQILCAVVAALLFASCNINNSIMLKVDRDFEFDPIPKTQSHEYVISPNDNLLFRLFAKDGYILIEMANQSNTGSARTQALGPAFNYVVEHDSLVNLPIIGRVKLAGYTLEEAELFLEEQYTSYYNDPYVMLTVSNRRIFVFPGNAGLGQVVTLQNNNTSLIEVLAQAGGITDRGKANSVRVIRKVDGEHKVYNIDLSTIDGLEHIGMLVQANDVIYVEPAPEIAREILQDITPVVTLFNSAILVYITLTRGL